MNKPTNGENLPHRPWISIEDKLPPDKTCVEYASHQTIGLANWSKEKGFHEIFETFGPHEEAQYYNNITTTNHDVMWWRKICDWPSYGTRGCDSQIMKDYELG